MELFSFSNIYRQYLNCRKSKRNTINALRFEIRAEENLLKLQEKLQKKSYYPSRSVCFVVKKPKLREIFAADFKDRVVHHVLVDYLEKIWEPKFIYDSYACRKNKGTHKGVKRLHSFIRKVTKNGSCRSYYMQLDIRGFFINIDKEILFNIIAKKAKNKTILWLAKTIIFHNCTKGYIFKGKRGLLKKIPAHKSLFNQENKRGLPIGNLTSQFFANVYLNEVDQFIKHNLKAKYYLRYCDDLVILHNDKRQLEIWKGLIDRFLQDRLKLTLHPNRQIIRPVSNGINFLGYIIRGDYILVRRRVVNNLKTKLKEYRQKLVYPVRNQRFSNGVYEKDGYKRLRFDYKVLENMLTVLSSYLAHFKLANAYKLKQHLWAEFDFINKFFFYKRKRLKRRYRLPRYA